MDVPLLPLLFLDTAWRVLLVMVGVGGVIFFHEMGHFLVARWCGVRTEAFSLAFPPNLLFGRREADGFRLKWLGCKSDGILLPFWKSETDPTEYRVGLIPLGGYVKMAGEGIGEGTGEPDELRSKNVAQRGAIFSAGVVMNVIFAFLAFTIAFQIGVPLESPTVGSIEPESPAEAAGFQLGDRVVTVDGRPIEVFADIIAAVAHAEGPVAIEVDRAGKRIALTPVAPKYSTARGLQLIGIRPAGTTILDRVSGAAAKAGLRRGDVVVAVAGTPVTWQWELDSAFAHAAQSSPESIAFSVDRSDGTEAPPERLEVALATADASFYQIGIEYLLAYQVEAVPAGHPLGAAGLQVGDLVTTIGDARLSATGFAAALAEAGGATVSCTLMRGEEAVTLELPTAPETWQSLTGKSVARISRVREYGAAQTAGLQPGWLIESVAGQPIDSSSQLGEIIQASKGEPVTLGVRESGATEARDVELRPTVFSTAALGINGLRAHKEVSRLGLGAAIAKGWDGTVKFAEQVLLMFKSLAQRRVSADNLGGPVTIVNVAYTFTEEGIGATLFFLGILSVNLAILNVLPIPVLDGGHLFFLLIEAVRRRPVSENVQIMAQYVGLLLLLGLMVFVTVNDIGRLF